MKHALDCLSCKYQKHVKQLEWRIRHLEQKLKAAREEISRLKAVNVSSRVRKQRNSNHWITPKISKSRCRRFSADDAPLVQLSNRFSLLETDTLDVGQKSPVLLKHEHKKVK
jgi:predicted RNase H-like nuclease (RuvC/YqgF family)